VLINPFSPSLKAGSVRGQCSKNGDQRKYNVGEEYAQRGARRKGRQTRSVHLRRKNGLRGSSGKLKKKKKSKGRSGKEDLKLAPGQTISTTEIGEKKKPKGKVGIRWEKTLRLKPLRFGAPANSASTKRRENAAQKKGKRCIEAARKCPVVKWGGGKIGGLGTRKGKGGSASEQSKGVGDGGVSSE